jgi:superfamily II DNA or RNA helicase/antitoxin component of MazEF toxin-antitoxin module
MMSTQFICHFSSFKLRLLKTAPIMYDLKILLSNFDRATIARSSAYIRQVIPSKLLAQSNENGVFLRTAIRGQSKYDYITEVMLSVNGQVVIAKCTCPVRLNCKHAAAVIQGFYQIKTNTHSHQARVVAPKPALVVPHVPAPVDAAEQRASQWLEKLRIQSHHLSDVVVKESPFIFVLKPKDQHSLQELVIQVEKVRRRKDGEITSAAAWDDFHGLKRRFNVPASERDLIARLYELKNVNSTYSGLLSTDGMNAALFKDVVATERLYWQNHEQGLIRWDDAECRLDFAWIDNDLQEQGQQKTTQLKTLWRKGDLALAEADYPHLYVLATEPLLYFDAVLHRVGYLHSDYTPALLRYLINAPSIPLTLLPKLEKLLDVLPSQALPRPEALRIVDHYGQPMPILLIEQPPPLLRMLYKGQQMGCAKVIFEYQGGRIAVDAKPSVFTGQVDGRSVQQHRDLKFEKLAVKHLLLSMPELQWLHKKSVFSMGSKNVPHDLLYAPSNSWFQWLLNPQLIAQSGWQVEHSADSPLRVQSVSAPEIVLHEMKDNTDQTDEMDWFGLGMYISTESGQRYNLAELLAQMVKNYPELLDAEALKQKEDEDFLYVPTSDQHHLALRIGDVRPILMHLLDLFNQIGQGGELRLDRYDALRVLDLQHTLGLAWQGSDRLQKLLDQFRQGCEQQMSAPEGFQGELRSYQEKGLAWLQFLRQTEHGGILADDMGLGKTPQTLAHVLTEKQAGRLDRPVLIIAPTSLMHNWRNEAEKFTPTLKVLTLHGQKRTEHFSALADYDIVLTTYPLLPRDETHLVEQHYHMLILDEAQNIKNPNAKAAQVVRKLHTRHRLCLTGTPMENHLGELWSLYHFLMPGFLGSQEVFNKRFRHPIEKQGERHMQAALVARIRPFMLRRRKVDVATELPPKTVIEVRVDMGSAQQKMYEAVRASMQHTLAAQIAEKGFKRSQIQILSALLKLRQVCCHPTLLQLESTPANIHSAKFDALLEMVSEMVEEGRRILIFSQFTTMLSLIENALKQAKIDTVKLTGQTKNRVEVIDAFQNGTTPVFLISLKAGGVGLNLTAADTVIHYDPWWNPAAEEQASDRAWRIGQDKPVFVYKLITADSIEEKILILQQRKTALIQGVISNDTEQTIKFSEEDLLQLLAPITV